MAEKDTLTQDFDNLQDKITTLFRPIYDKLDEFFFELIGKFQKAGVDFLEINNFKKTAIAKHSNYYEYPERRYAIVVDDNSKVKFYELEFKSADIDKNAKEISQQEFEQLTIPTYLKPNPLMSKKDAEEDKDPSKKQEEQFGKDPSKEKSDKDALSQEKPEDKKLLNYGDTSSPKVKESKERNEGIEEVSRISDEEIKKMLLPKIKDNGVDLQDFDEIVATLVLKHHGSHRVIESKVERILHTLYDEKIDEVSPPGWEGTVKAMKKHKDITNPWALSWYMKNKGFKSHKKEENLGYMNEKKAKDAIEAGKILKESGVAFDDTFKDKEGLYFFKGDKLVAKWDPETQLIEATEKPVIDITDTQGYTGNEANLGPLEAKGKMSKCPECKQMTLNNTAKIEGKPANYCENCGYLAFAKKKEEVSGKEETYPAIQQPAIPGQNETKQYKVKFVNKDGKEDSVILEAKNVKEAATKAYKFGATSIISADKYEKTK